MIEEYIRDLPCGVIEIQEKKGWTSIDQDEGQELVHLLIWE
jgi:hypothetical protein